VVDGVIPPDTPGDLPAVDAEQMVQVLAVEEDPAAVSPVFGQKKELRQSASRQRERIAVPRLMTNHCRIRTRS
jgi:hypothetical protein